MAESAPFDDSPMQRVDHALSLALSEPEQGLALAQAVAQQAQTQPGSVDVASGTLSRLVLALICLRLSRVDEAQQWMTQAQQRLQNAPNDRAQDLLLHLQAHLKRLEGDLAGAQAMLEPLHQRADGRPPLDAFHTAMALGTVQGMQGLHQDSLSTYYKGVELAQRTGLLSLEVNALNNLGAFQLDLYNLEDASRLLQRCLDGAQAIGSRRQIIFAAGNLLECVSAMGQASKALALARLLIGLIREEDPPSLQRDEEIAQALLDNQLVDEARTYLARHVRSDVLTNPMTAVRVWLQVRLLLADAQPEAALQLALQHRDIVDDEAHAPAHRIHLTEITAEAARRLGRWALAYEHQHRAYLLKDALLGQAAKARYLSLQIQFELEAAHRERDEARRLAAELEAANRQLRDQVQANEQLRQQLETMALEDPLTGLANRRQLFRSGEAMLATAAREGVSVAVAVLDLDHFKSVNDQHGHDAGDRVLQALAGLMRRSVRAGDLCARQGGEEFVIVLANSRSDQAAARLRTLLRAFREVPFTDADGRFFSCSFSAGVVAAHDGQVKLPQMLQQADVALYRAKAAGRSCVIEGAFEPGSTRDR